MKQHATNASRQHHARAVRLPTLVNILLLLPTAYANRRAAAADQAAFAYVNALLYETVVQMPEVGATTSGVRVAVWDIECGNAQMQGLSVETESKPLAAHDEYTLGLGLDGITLVCTASWWAGLGPISETGTVRLRATNANLAVALRLYSLETTPADRPTNVAPSPPAELSNCDVDIPLAIDDITSQTPIGNLLSISALQDFILGLVQGDIHNVVCNAVSDATPAIDASFSGLGSFLAPYIAQSSAPPAWEATEEACEAEALAANVTLASVTAELANEEDIGIHPLLELVRSALGAAPGALGGLGRLEVDAATIASVIPGLNLSSLVLVDSDLAIVRASIHSVTLTGLDTLELPRVLEADSDRTLHTSLALGELGIEVSLSLRFDSSDSDDAIVSGPSLVEPFTLRLGTGAVGINVATLVALDQARLNSLSLSSLATEPVGCLSRLLFDFELSSLRLLIDDIIGPYVDGFINEQFDDVVEIVVDAASGLLESALLQAIPAISESAALGAASGAVDAALDQLRASARTCPAALPAGGSDYYDFTDNTTTFGSLLEAFNGLVADDAASGLASNVNQLVGQVTGGGTIRVGSLVDVGFDWPKEFIAAADFPWKHMDLLVANLTLSNLATWHEVGVVAANATTLHASAAAGTLARPVTLELAIDARVVGKDDTVGEEHFDLSVGLSEVTVELFLRLLVDGGRLGNLRLDEFIHPTCWFAAIERATIAEMRAAIGAISQFGVVCTGCYSPILSSLAERSLADKGQQGILTLLNDALSRVESYAESDDAQAVIERVLTFTKDSCAALVANELPPALLSLEVDSCTENAKVDLSNLGILSGAPTWQIALIVGGLLLCVGSYLYWLRKRWLRVKRNFKGAPNADDPYAVRLHHARTRALFRSEVMPNWVRVVVPIVLVGNAVLFVTGHLALGATVDFTASGGDAGQVTVPAYFTFSILQSTFDMYQAGAVFLACVLFAFSGMWPYIKLAIMLFLWMAPPWLVAQSNRGSTYSWLDALGKWSMIDIYVMICSLVAFSLTIAPPVATDFLLGGLKIEMYVTPRYGLYANMLAQVVSQFASHVCLAYHRRHLRLLAHLRKLVARREAVASLKQRDASAAMDLAERGAGAAAAVKEAKEIKPVGELQLAKESPDADTTRANIADHTFQTAKATYRQITPLGKLCLAAGAFLVLPLALAGAAMYSFRFEINGLLGMLMESGPNGRLSPYSVFDIAQAVAQQAHSTLIHNAEGYLSFVGMYAIVCVLIICTVAIPILQAMMLLVLTFYPLSSRRQKELYIASEIVSSWSYLEVYLISIILTMTQIDTISRFMVGCLCNGLVPIFEEIVDAGVLSSTQAECFFISATIESGYWVLLMADLFLIVSTQIMMRAARGKFAEDERRGKGLPRPSPGLFNCVSIPGFKTIRMLLTRRLNLVDEHAPIAVREAVARSLNGAPVYQDGEWMLLWDERRRAAARMHVRTGELRPADDAQAAAFERTLAVSMPSAGEATPTRLTVFTSASIDGAAPAPSA